MTWSARIVLFSAALLWGGLAVILADLAFAEPIVTESTSEVTTNGSMTTTVKSPPPSAIAPQFSGGSNSDLCTVGATGAVQTQILGISIGSTFTEENCLRLKRSKTVFDMGLKVAAISIMCQDPDVFAGMESAGTPCPHKGRIGDEAQAYWDANPDDRPWIKKTELVGDDDETAEDKRLKALGIVGSIFGSLLFF